MRRVQYGSINARGLQAVNYYTAMYSDVVSSLKNPEVKKTDDRC